MRYSSSVAGSEKWLSNKSSTVWGWLSGGSAEWGVESGVAIGVALPSTMLLSSPWSSACIPCSGFKPSPEGFCFCCCFCCCFWCCSSSGFKSDEVGEAEIAEGETSFLPFFLVFVFTAVPTAEGLSLGSAERGLLGRVCVENPSAPTRGICCGGFVESPSARVCRESLCSCCWILLNPEGFPLVPFAHLVVRFLAPALRHLAMWSSRSFFHCATKAGSLSLLAST